MPHIHYLKTGVHEYRDVRVGDKTFQIRWNDHGFQVNDILVLREYDLDRNEYSGEQLVMRVNYIVNGPNWNLPVGLCVMAVVSVPNDQMIGLRDLIVAGHTTE